MLCLMLRNVVIEDLKSTVIFNRAKNLPNSTFHNLLLPVCTLRTTMMRNISQCTDFQKSDLLISNRHNKRGELR